MKKEVEVYRLFLRWNKLSGDDYYDTYVYNQFALAYAYRKLVRATGIKKLSRKWLNFLFKK